jgi:SAM-dependent methyltransferase
LCEALLEAVATAGLDLHTATPDDLAPLDQFHGGGKVATRMLADQAAVAVGMRVLDVGGGLGEPARMLAVEYGATVTVLDLTTDYLQAGELLTACLHLAEQVTFHHGNALDLPYIDYSCGTQYETGSGLMAGVRCG